MDLRVQCAASHDRGPRAFAPRKSSARMLNVMKLVRLSAGLGLISCTVGSFFLAARVAGPRWPDHGIHGLPQYLLVAGACILPGLAAGLAAVRLLSTAPLARSLWAIGFGLGWLVGVMATIVFVLGMVFAGSGEGSSVILAALALPWAVGGAALTWLAHHQLQQYRTVLQ